MKKLQIIFVDRPYQKTYMVDPFLINGEVHEWTVTCNNLKVNESFQEFLQRKEEYISTKEEYNDINSMLVYNIQPQRVNNHEIAMMVRYALKHI